jgi:hypothetical protein
LRHPLRPFSRVGLFTIRNLTAVRRKEVFLFAKPTKLFFPALLASNRPIPGASELVATRLSKTLSGCSR